MRGQGKTEVPDLYYRDREISPKPFQRSLPCVRPHLPAREHLCHARELAQKTAVSVSVWQCTKSETSNGMN